MRINDTIYFAPDIKLSEVSLTDRAQLLEAFTCRINEFYFRPLDILLQNEFAFASGALECVLIDVFSRYTSTTDKVGTRMKQWCRKYLSCSKSESEKFYNFFRNGLIHEGHIKSLGQFSLDSYFTKPINSADGYIIVNPSHVLEMMRTFFEYFISSLKVNSDAYEIFLARFKKDFEEEIRILRDTSER